MEFPEATKRLRSFRYGSTVGGLDMAAIDTVLAEIDRLRAEMKEIAAFSEAHHGDQEKHVLLHALRVDIPHRLREAAEAVGGKRGDS